MVKVVVWCHNQPVPLKHSISCNTNEVRLSPNGELDAEHFFLKEGNNRLTIARLEKMYAYHLKKGRGI